jgi:hypothetical protein
VPGSSDRRITMAMNTMRLAPEILRDHAATLNAASGGRATG